MKEDHYKRSYEYIVVETMIWQDYVFEAIGNCQENFKILEDMNICVKFSKEIMSLSGVEK